MPSAPPPPFLCLSAFSKYFSLGVRTVLEQHEWKIPIKYCENRNSSTSIERVWKWSFHARIGGRKLFNALARSEGSSNASWQRIYPSANECECTFIVNAYKPNYYYWPTQYNRFYFSTRKKLDISLFSYYSPLVKSCSITLRYSNRSKWWGSYGVKVWAQFTDSDLVHIYI